MAHFAQISGNLVVKVIVVDDGMATTDAEGIAFCQRLFGGTWLRTSYNTQGGIHRTGGAPLRMNYANEGYTYDSDKDAFIPPKPYPSWILNETTCLWEAPTRHNMDGKTYAWDETIKDWVEVTTVATLP